MFLSRMIHPAQMITDLAELFRPVDPEMMQVADSVVRYIGLRLHEGLLRETDTYRHLHLHLVTRFAGELGHLNLRDLTAEQLRGWLAALPVAPLTKRHHLVSVKTFLKRAHAEGWVMRDVSMAVKPPIVEEEDVEVIPVRQAWQFFRANRDHRAIGRVALEAFGGLRYSSAALLQVGDIKWELHGLEMPAAKHKSRKRKFRQGQPDNLWAWLKHAPDACWSLTKRQYASEKAEMLVNAGLRPMICKSDDDRQRLKRLRNVWRHSFASYLLARLKSYAPVQYLMQHSKASTTEIYEGRATERDACLYFAITPDTVLQTWEEFSHENNNRTNR